MLPFLDKKKMSGMISARVGKPEVIIAPESEAPDSEEDSDLKEAAMDVLSAIERKSVRDLSKALRAAFEICDSYPHEEGPHLEEEEE